MNVTAIFADDSATDNIVNCLACERGGKRGTGHRPRILLADDHVPVIEEVLSLLEDKYQILGIAVNGRSLVSEAMRLKPDVIVADISMPELSGIEAAHELRELGSSARFVFLTVHERPEFVKACMAEGGFGYVVKSRLTADLVRAISDAFSGIRFISPSLPR